MGKHIETCDIDDLFMRLFCLFLVLYALRLFEACCNSGNGERSWSNYVNLLTTSLSESLSLQSASLIGTSRERLKFLGGDRVLALGRWNVDHGPSCHRQGVTWRCAIKIFNPTQWFIAVIRSWESAPNSFSLISFAHRKAIKINNNYET